MQIAKFLMGGLVGASTFVSATMATALDEPQGLPALGKPVDGLLGFQAPATELMRDVIWLDNFLLWITGLITLFVTLLLVWAIFRFNAKKNPTPATFTHHTGIEITWTVVPILVLLAIMPPSLNLLFKQQEIPAADITIKATGNQWYWTHEYVDNEFEFDSIMLEKEELAEYGYAADEYLLATDTAVVVPINKKIVVQVTAADVIHAWTIPAFGVKQDGVPGRLAELWFEVEKEGVYFGQCSELCGKDHSYMPIVVKAVSQDKYDAWLASAIAEYDGVAIASN
jgi:cytochrome c oxidase subunit 2